MMTLGGAPWSAAAKLYCSKRKDCNKKQIGGIATSSPSEGIARSGSGGGGGLRGNVVDLLLVLFEYYRTIIPGGESAPLVDYKNGGELKV